MRVGDVLESPKVGQRFTLRELSAEAVRFTALIRPGSQTVPHVHLHQTEHFLVREGRLTTWAAGRRAVIGPGEEVTVAPRTPHRFVNRSGADVVADVALRPGLRSGELFALLCALDVAGRVNRLGVPGPLSTALLVERFGEEFPYPAYLPPVAVRIAARPAAALARRIGTILPPVS